MKKRWDLLIWVVLALVLVIYLIFRNDNKISYTLPEWNEFEVENIQSIELASENGSFSLNKSGENWMIEPGADKANSGSVSSLASQLSSLKFIDMVSEKGSLSRFGLDDDEAVLLNIKLKEGDPVPSLYIGETSSSQKYTYVRFAGEEIVYTVRGNINRNAYLSNIEFRDKTVFELDGTQVNEVLIKTPGMEYSAVKEGENWNLSSADNALDIEAFINRFSNLNAVAWEDTRQDSEDWDYSFVFKSSGGEKSLSFNTAGEDEKEIKAVSSSAKHPFTLASSFADEIKLLISGDKAN